MLRATKINMNTKGCDGIAFLYGFIPRVIVILYF